MKQNYIVTFLLLFVLSLHSNELTWVDEQVKAIKPARVGIDTATISNVKDPFVFIQKKRVVKKKRKPAVRSKVVHSKTEKTSTQNTSTYKVYTKPKKDLKLELIINKSVRIDGKWYKLNSMVDGYTVSSIENDSVVLKKGNKRLILSTSLGKSQNIKFKN